MLISAALLGVFIAKNIEFAGRSLSCLRHHCVTIASPLRQYCNIRSQFSSQRHLMRASAFIGYRILRSDPGSAQNGQEAGE
jgi:hypothetical protein